MATDYVHSQLNEQIDSIGGHYVVEKEVRMPYKEREVLVAFGYGVVNKSCCGEGGCRFANVPGYILDWKTKSAPDGSPVSNVEPVEDKTEQREIHEMIDKAELYCQVNFL